MDEDFCEENLNVGNNKKTFFQLLMTSGIYSPARGKTWQIFLDKDQ